MKAVEELTTASRTEALSALDAAIAATAGDGESALNRARRVREAADQVTEATLQTEVALTS